MLSWVPEEPRQLLRKLDLSGVVRDFDFSLSATAGGIVVGAGAISNIGAGNVTLTAPGAVTDGGTTSISIRLMACLK